jgi:hypothetical protein
VRSPESRTFSFVTVSTCDVSDAIWTFCFAIVASYSAFWFSTVWRRSAIVFSYLRDLR